MAPRILVSTMTGGDRHLNYTRALEKAGAEHVVIREDDGVESAVESAADADGWLIMGGRDLPENYAKPCGWPTHDKVTKISEKRLDIESALYEAFDSTDKPMLGICLGAQFLNWKSGGAIYQHFPEDLNREGHGSTSMDDEPTIVSIEPNTLLSASIGASKLEVKCHHHQAIRTVGNGYRAVAWEDAASQPIIEAIEDEAGRWRIGVQWHPERTPTKESDNLFKAFVEACAIRR